MKESKVFDYIVIGVLLAFIIATLYAVIFVGAKHWIIPSLILIIFTSYYLYYVVNKENE